jgi:hypothetical protein
VVFSNGEQLWLADGFHRLVCFATEPLPAQSAPPTHAGIQPPR